MQPGRIALALLAAATLALVLEAPDEARDASTPEVQIVRERGLSLRMSGDLMKPVRAQSLVVVESRMDPVNLRRSVEISDVSGQSPSSGRKPDRAATETGVNLSALTVARDPGDARELFEAKSWFVAPPPPPPAPPTPPPEPTAPPLPFRFVGRLDDGSGSVTYFVNQGTSLRAMKVGESIDGTYRFDSDSGGVLQFTFLPLNTRQTLAIGAGP